MDKAIQNLYQHQVVDVIKPKIDPQGLISTILQIAKFIYDTAQLVQANKHRCKTLAERINKMAKTLSELQALPDNSHFVDDLTELKKVLEHCQAFVINFTDESTKNLLSDLQNALSRQVMMQVILMGLITH